MQRKISKIALKMTAVLMAVVVCLPLAMNAMKQNVYAASINQDAFKAYFDYNNGTGKTDYVYWTTDGISMETDNSFPEITSSDYPTKMSVFEGWFLVDDDGNMTTTEVTESYAASSTFTAKAKWSESAYEITIPATTSIDSTDKTGSVDFSGKLGKYKEMSIAVSSANGNKMVNGSYDVEYTMDKNSFSYESDDAIKTFSDSINFEVTGEPAVAGSYKDTLTFTISAEAKTVEVTVDHNDGAGTTSTVKLAVGEVILANLPAITREGYKLLGWTYTDASGNEVEVTEDAIYDGKITGFKANWANMSPVLQSGADFYNNIYSEATSIEFTTEAMPSTVTDYTDVSEAQDGSILAYMDGTTMKVSPKTEGATIYANANSYNMFLGATDVESITFSNFNTSEVTNMYSMFQNCENLTSLDVTGFDTSKVTNMSGMFAGCSSLTSLDVSNFNTSNVTNMLWMFSSCKNLTTLDVSSFNTSNVTNMSHMFYDCSSLTSLDVSNFDTSKVTNMYSMFDTCSNLTALNLSNFDTSEVTSMYSMFRSCSNLTSLNLSGFNTNTVTDMASMFNKCVKLTTLDVSSFDTSKVTNMYSMFDNCSSLTTLDLSNFKTNLVTSMSGMFSGCSSLTELDVSGFDTSKVTNMFYMFNGCSSLTSLDVTSFDTSKVTNMQAMFGGCSGLTSLDLKNFNTSKVTDMKNMFNGCSNLATLDLSSFDTTNVTSYQYVFGSCSKLSQIAVGDKWMQNIAFPNTGVSSAGKWYALSSGTEYAYNAIPTGTADVYTVTKTTGIVFDAGDGTFEDGSKINYVINGDMSTYKIATVSDTGKVFKGWATTSDATEAEYKADGSDLPTDYNGKLYAVMGNGSMITFNAGDGGTFDDGSTVNRIIYGETRNIVKYSHTDNISDDGTQNGNYGNNEAKTEVVTIEGATSLTVTVTYGGQSNYSDWVSIFTGTHSEYTADDYSKADIAQRLGGGSHTNQTKTYTVSGDSVTFAWKSNSSGYGDGYGYYAVVTSEATPVISSSYKQPTSTDINKYFAGWSTDSTATDVTYSRDGLDIPRNNNSSLYAVYKDLTYTLQAGTSFNKNIAGTVTAVEFTTEAMPSTVTDYTDVSEAQDGSILAYMDGTTMKVSPKYDEKIIYANENCSNMFDTSSYDGGSKTNAKISTIKFNNFSTSKVIDMHEMFYGCSLLTLDLSNFDTSNVTNMNAMFSSCAHLETIDVSSFNTAKVINMQRMFFNCYKLTSLDLSDFDTSNVGNMTGMFYYCSSLTSLNLKNFNTVNVTDMNLMFSMCTSLASLDLSSFNTQSITDIGKMFSYSQKLAVIYVSKNFAISDTALSSGMFDYCKSLVGGNGTKYNSSYTDATYARIDTASTPGYFTLKSSDDETDDTDIVSVVSWDDVADTEEAIVEEAEQTSSDSKADEAEDVIIDDTDTATEEKAEESVDEVGRNGEVEATATPAPQTSLETKAEAEEQATPASEATVAPASEVSGE